MVDLAAPDLGRFPRFRDAAAVSQSATLELGDAIYIPFSWWHGVESLDPVSGLVNYWWNQAPSNLPQPYSALTLSIAALRNLPVEHRRAWRTLYEHYVFADDDLAAGHLPTAAKGVLGAPSVDMFRRLQATLTELLSR